VKSIRIGLACTWTVLVAACGGGGGGGETVGAAPPPSTTTGAPSASGAPAPSASGAPAPAPTPTSAPAPAPASAPAVTAFGPVVLQQRAFDVSGLSAPALTRLPNGTTVAVFTSQNQFEVQLVDGTGRVLGPPIAIATSLMTGYSVATLANGDWLIGWLESPQGSGSATFRARRYTATGGFVQDIAQPVPLQLSFAAQLSIAGAPGGGFAAAWTTYPSRMGGYPSLWRFDAAGQPQGQVFTMPTVMEDTPKALVMADGSVLLASATLNQSQLMLRHVDGMGAGLGDARVVATNPSAVGFARYDLQPASGNTAVLAWNFTDSASSTVGVQWIDATGALLRPATTTQALSSVTAVSAAPRADGSLALYVQTMPYEQTSSASVLRSVLLEVPVDASGSMGGANTVLDVTNNVMPAGSGSTIGPSQSGFTVAPRPDGHDVIGYARGVAGGSEALVQGR
jgi:hypothetical protein